MVVDANVWISAARQNETRYPASIAWLRTQIRSHAVIEIPTLALAEVGGAMARISGSPGAGRLSVRDLLAIPDLRLIDMDRRLTYEASLLATRLRLRGADAIYVAIGSRRSSSDRPQSERVLSITHHSASIMTTISGAPSPWRSPCPFRTFPSSPSRSSAAGRGHGLLSTPFGNARLAASPSKS